MRELVEELAGYIQSDPKVALGQLRLAAEKVTSAVAENNRIPFAKDAKLVDQLRELEKRRCIPSAIVDRLHKIRILGNAAIHDGCGTSAGARESLELFLVTLRGYEEEFPYPRPSPFGTFEAKIQRLAFHPTGDALPFKTNVAKSSSQLGEHQPNTPDSEGGPHNDWLSETRRATERLLVAAEHGARQATVWAKPRTDRIKSLVREKAGQVLRRASQRLENFANKRHG